MKLLSLYGCSICICRVLGKCKMFFPPYSNPTSTLKNPKDACWGAIYPRFLRYHQALSTLPLLHPWRFLAQQEIKF